VPLSTCFFEAIRSLPKESAPEVRELGVEEFDNVEVIEHDGGIRKVFPYGAYIGRRHVNGHSLDFPCRTTPQPFPEGLQGIDTLAVAHEHYGPTLKIQRYRQVLVTLADADLINGNPL